MQDTFKEAVSSLVERKVRSWLRGVIDEMNRSSPVQQWLDSLPAEVFPNQTKDEEKQNTPEGQLEALDVVKEGLVVTNDKELNIPNSQELSKSQSLDSAVASDLSRSKEIGQNKNQLSSTKKLQRDYSIQSEGCSPKMKNPLLRDYSLQSDGSGSSGSSVLNVLGARKVDAESVLLDMGFGPSEKQQKLRRIPDRFLVPSQLKGISTEKFIKDEQHSMRLHDCGIFGYRGLTGNPHVPPSNIVAKIMDCILKDDVYREQTVSRARFSVPDIRSSTSSILRNT